MNKNIKIVSSALLSSLLVAGYALPVYAEGEETTTTEETTTETVESTGVTKNESVYAVLNADGSVKTVTVSDTLHSDNGFDNYSDTSDLINPENLKSDEEVTNSNGTITWNTDSTDIYYQGSSTKELPLDVSIKYYLNDKEYKPTEIAGKSGHVKIKIEVTNNSKQSYTVNGKTYDLVTPFITAAGLMMDEDNFSNVEVNHGTVSSDSSHSIVAAVMIPGLREGLESTIDADVMDKVSDYLIDDITIEADTDNFESPTMMLAAATSTDALKDQFEGTDISSLFDQLDQLKDATNQLITGTQSLYDGAVQLNDGVGTLQSGAESLSSGASQVATGANSLYAGLTQLSSNSATINAGMDTLASSILATVNEQLKAANMSEVTWDNYSSVLTASYSAAIQKVKQTIAQTSGLEVDSENYKTLVYMAALNLANNENPTAEQMTGWVQSAGATLTSVATYKANYATATEIAKHLAAGNFTDTQVASVMTTLKAANSGATDAQVLQSVLAQIKSSKEGMDDSTAMVIFAMACVETNGTYSQTMFSDAAAHLTTLNTVGGYATAAQSADQLLNSFYAKLAEANGAAKLNTALTTLSSTDALVKGVKSYTAGVDTCASGAGTLASGASQVADGAAQVSSGTDTLKSGSQQLADGAKTLKDGMEQYNDEAISKLTDNSKISTIEDLSDLFTEIQNSDDNYNNYSGISNGTEGSVKFIYKVNGVESTESTKSTTTTTEEESEDKESFLDRLVGLFNISTLFSKD